MTIFRIYQQPRPMSEHYGSKVFPMSDQDRATNELARQRRKAAQ